MLLEAAFNQLLNYDCWTKRNLVGDLFVHCLQRQIRLSVSQGRGQESAAAAAAVGYTDAAFAAPGPVTYPCLTALFLFTSMVVMECLAPDCTSQSTFH